jgi:hypothetical protein
VVLRLKAEKDLLPHLEGGGDKEEGVVAHEEGGEPHEDRVDVVGVVDVVGKHPGLGE